MHAHAHTTHTCMHMMHHTCIHTPRTHEGMHTHTHTHTHKRGY